MGREQVRSEMEHYALMEGRKRVNAAENSPSEERKWLQIN
jgi:hypothetical protein